MADFDLEDVRVWRDVVRAESFSAAAREHRTSASSVTRAVERLEARVGATLLVRTTRRVYLTPAGERFFAHSTAILSAAEEAVADVSAGGLVRGTLRLTASATFGRIYLMPIIAEFLAQHGEVDVDLHLTDTVVDLVREGFDLAVRIGPLSPSDLVRRTLTAERRILCASPTYLGRHGSPQRLDDLAEHQCILFSGERSWQLLDDKGQEVSVPVRGPLRVNFGDAGLQAAEQGLGVIRLSIWHAAESLRSGALVPVLLDRAPPGYGEIAAVYPARRYLPARVRAFVDLIATRLKMPPWTGVLRSENTPAKRS